MLHGEETEAMLQYSAAVSEARGSVKGNYNLAMLEMSLTGDLVKAREHFKFSSSFIKFPYSFLNWGNLEQSEYSPRQASVVMRRGTREVPNAYLSNNLAKAFLQLDEPDSAILEMKEALRLQPDNSAFYSNLGRIYMDYDKVDEAKKFLESGLDLPKVHRATVTNALFLNLRHGSKIAVSEDLLQLPHIRESWETNFNFAIDRYHQGDIEGARRLLTRNQPEAASYSDSTASGSLRADSLLLDGMLLFEKGEIARAISRMDFIDVNFPVYRPYTNHFL
ncbi:MAG TPA: tetratricopeptide repeat protein, partial [Bacteroidia bacterium]|nr:tetratricopeptide repeat protein [Bacteroidia bacterium]